jgi:hypothetical protein
MLYHELDYGLGKERVLQMRKEGEHNRLEARLAKAASLSEEASCAGAGSLAAQRSSRRCSGKRFLI